MFQLQRCSIAEALWKAKVWDLGEDGEASLGAGSVGAADQISEAILRFKLLPGQGSNPQRK